MLTYIHNPFWLPRYTVEWYYNYSNFTLWQIFPTPRGDGQKFITFFCTLSNSSHCITGSGTPSDSRAVYGAHCITGNADLPTLLPDGPEVTGLGTGNEDEDLLTAPDDAAGTIVPLSPCPDDSRHLQYLTRMAHIATTELHCISITPSKFHLLT